MEQLSIRDWMVIIGGMMIAAVLIDAFRRYWRERRAEIRLNAKIERASPTSNRDDAFNLLTELPNGGARIVRRNDLLDVDKVANFEQTITPRSDSESGGEAPSAAISDPIDVAAAQRAVNGHGESIAGEGGDIAASTPQVPSADCHQSIGDGRVEESSVAAPPSPDSVGNTDSRRRTIKSPSVSAEPSEQAIPDSGTLDWLETLQADGEEPAQAEREALPIDAPAHGRLPRGADTHVFILFVVARAEEGFSGTEVLETLLACDLRFGDMDFFHRHERASGRGAIEFSVANMMKPGVFDVDNMEPLQTRGLMFFVTLPGPADMLKAFDCMYETVKLVAKQLDGDVQDETRSVVTRQSLEHMRQQVRELERRLLVRRN